MSLLDKSAIVHPTQDLSIKETARLLDTEQTYIRVLIKKGRLEAYKVTLPNKSNGYKQMVRKESIIAYLTGGVKRTRPDGKRRYVAMLTPAEVEQIRAMGIEIREGSAGRRKSTLPTENTPTTPVVVEAAPTFAELMYAALDEVMVPPVEPVKAKRSSKRQAVKA